MMERQYKSTWESLSQNKQVPDWFRDAKLGVCGTRGHNVSLKQKIGMKVVYMMKVVGNTTII